MAVIVMAMLISIPSVLAQTVNVRGKVVDETGQPVISAGIMEKGTSNGTITDMDGNYSISIKPGATLVFSYIGFETQEVANARGVTDVILREDRKVLEEVVVVGYGVQKKSDLTGAISQVKSEDIEHRTITSAAQALQGKTAGVQVLTNSAAPGASPNILIRGVSSNSSSAPLYVIDGRIGSIAGIDPNDIESMEVLKDAASAAIYGVAAGNGVILVTTRKGRGNGTISYDYQYTTQSLARVPHMMNSEQWIQYFTEAGLLNMDKVNQYWDFKTNTDWTREAFENSLMQHHNLSFSSGDEKGTLFVSGSYLDNNGMIKGDSDIYSRLTGMINATRNIKPWLEIGTNNQIEYYKSRSVSEGSEYGSFLLSVLQLDPLTPVSYNVNNLPDYLKEVYDDPSMPELLGDGNGNIWAPSQFVTGENIHPFVSRDSNYSTSRGFNINGSTYVNFKPIKGLVFTSRVGYMFGSSESYGYANDYYYSSQKANDLLSVSASTYANTYWQWENFANYNHTFKGGHNFNAMVGMSFSESRSFGVSGSIKGSGWNEDHTSFDSGFKKDDPLFLFFSQKTNSS